MPLPVRKDFALSAAAREPQRFVRFAEVCDNCHGVDTFRARVTLREKGVTYLVCSRCGRSATRQTVIKK